MPRFPRAEAALSGLSKLHYASATGDANANRQTASPAAISALPDDATLEEIVYRLHVVESIHAGLADIEAGRTVSHDEVKAELAKQTGWVIHPPLASASAGLPKIAIPPIVAP